MTDTNITALQDRLTAEKESLERELRSRGTKDAETNDWQGGSDAAEADMADENVVADAIEELATNVAVVEELERRLQSVNRALERIDAGTYGICEIGGEEIEEGRLEANPAARTCTSHMGEESKLV